jgi:hypothetical protein
VGGGWSARVRVERSSSARGRQWRPAAPCSPKGKHWRLLQAARSTGGDSEVTRAEMPSCYDAPRSVCVRPYRRRTGGPPCARRTYDTATGRRVAWGNRGVLGRGDGQGKVCGLGRRVASAGGGLGRGRRGGAATLRPTT